MVNVQLTSVMASLDESNSVVQPHNHGWGGGHRFQSQVRSQAIKMSLLGFKDQVPRVENGVVTLDVTFEMRLLYKGSISYLHSNMESMICQDTRRKFRTPIGLTFVSGIGSE